MKRFLACAAIVLLGDQLTKWIARSTLADGAEVRVLGDLLRLRLVHNPGSAFGVVQGNRWVFVAISLLAIGLIFYLVLTRRHTFTGSFLAFGAVLGGAIGNLWDRLYLREVVDFIDMGIGPHRWPTYNVADIGLTLGVIFLAIGFLFLEPRVHRPPENTLAEPPDG